MCVGPTHVSFGGHQVPVSQEGLHVLNVVILCNPIPEVVPHVMDAQPADSRRAILPAFLMADFHPLPILSKCHLWGSFGYLSFFLLLSNR